MAFYFGATKTNQSSRICLDYYFHRGSIILLKLILNGYAILSFIFIWLISGQRLFLRPIEYLDSELSLDVLFLSTRLLSRHHFFNMYLLVICDRVGSNSVLVIIYRGWQFLGTLYGKQGFRTRGKKWSLS